MSYRKYLKDYEIEEYVDEKGRVKTRAVYSAGYYAVSPAVAHGDKIIMLAFSFLSWVLLIGALVFETGAARLWYVILPFTFTVFPLFYMTAASVSLMFGDDKLTRERAEKMSRRLPTSPLIAAILTGAAFIGLVATALISWGSIPLNDILFAVFALAVSFSASLVYTKCRRLKTEVIN